jgi:hypothetical protein
MHETLLGMRLGLRDRWGRPLWGFLVLVGIARCVAATERRQELLRVGGRPLATPPAIANAGLLTSLQKRWEDDLTPRIRVLQWRRSGKHLSGANAQPRWRHL